MKHSKIIAEALFFLSLFVMLSLSGCRKSTDGDIEFDYEMLYGLWGATEIQGALDPQGNPLDVDSTVSSIYFGDDKIYGAFLYAPPWYDISGDGDYSYSNGRILVTGFISDMLGVSSIAYTPGSKTISFLDDDGDRWTYIKCNQ